MRRNLFRATAALFLLSLWAVPGAAQESAAGAAPARQDAASGPAAQQGTEADETFELNITERRITERDFAAKTSVEAGEESARGLSLRVGVEVGAKGIDVLLRNVRGHVRFRATLDRVLERLNSRRPPETAP